MKQNAAIGLVVGILLVALVWGIQVKTSKTGSLHLKTLFVGLLVVILLLLAYVGGSKLFGLFGEDNANAADEEAYAASQGQTVQYLYGNINRYNLSYAGYTGNTEQDMAQYTSKANELFAMMNSKDGDPLNLLKDTFYNWCKTPDDIKMLSYKYAVRRIDIWTLYMLLPDYISDTTQPMTLRQTIEYIYSLGAIRKLDRDGIMSKFDWAGIS